MQLKKALATAVASLIVSSNANAEQWLVDSSVLLYQEKDSEQKNRVYVFAPVFSIKKENAIDDFVKLTLIYDSLSGASPNGSHASSSKQVFGKNITDAGLTPLDYNFKDKRYALSLAVMNPINRFNRYQYGFSFSTESDYRSIGSNISYFHDLFSEKITTLNFSIAYTADGINPVGGIKEEMSIVNTNNLSGTTAASGVGVEDNDSLLPGNKKYTFDALIGVSHVLNKLTLLNFNYTISAINGYQTDPYKIISVVNKKGLPTDYRWESRPDSRVKNTIKTSIVTAIGKDSLHLSYRYFFDNWEIKTHTYDIKYRLTFNKNLYIVPHYRLSQQSKAGFYRISLRNSEPLFQFASSDYRIGDLTTSTYGILAGYKFNDRFNITVSAEQMTQKGNSYPNEAIGDQKNNDLFPTVKSWIYIIGFRGKL